MDDIFGACIEGDADQIRTILSGDPDAVRGRSEGMDSTPLHFAAHRGFLEIVDLLLEAGAGVNAVEGCSGTTPLHWAAESGQRDVVRRLIDRGAELDVRDTWHDLGPVGWATVVVHAPDFHSDRAATAVDLVKAGAERDIFSTIAGGDPGPVRDMIQRDPGGLGRRLGFLNEKMPPLHFAVDRDLPEIVAVLLEGGADTDAVTSTGLTALAMAMDRGNDRLVKQLRAAGAADDLSTALVAGDLDQIRERLASGADVGKATQLLQFTARTNRAAEAEVLLKHGVDPDAGVTALCVEIPTTMTPLHLAARSGGLDVARVLMENGAAVGARGSACGTTPLHLAAFGGHTDVVRLLVERGADPEARDEIFGATPIGWAEHSGKADTLATLKELDASS